MKVINISVLSFEVPHEVPESVDEFNILAKREGACLDEATMNVVYRGSLPEIRDGFVEALEKATSIAPLGENRETGEKDADGKPTTEWVVTEPDRKYVNRVFAKLAKDGGKTEELIRAEYLPVILEVAAKVKFDPSMTVREIKAKKPSKVALATIDNILQQGVPADKLAAGLTAKLVEFDPQSQPVKSDRDSLALAFMQHEKNEAAKRRAATVAELAVA